MCSGRTCRSEDSPSSACPFCSASSMRSASTLSPLVTRLVIRPAIYNRYTEGKTQGHVSGHGVAAVEGKKGGRVTQWAGQAPAGAPTCCACAGGAPRAVQVVDWIEWKVKVDDVVNPARDVQPPAQAYTTPVGSMTGGEGSAVQGAEAERWAFGGGGLILTKHTRWRQRGR